MQTVPRTQTNDMWRPAVTGDPRGLRILAKTIYKELRTSGLREDEVVAIATELLGHVTDEIRGAAQTAAAE